VRGVLLTALTLLHRAGIGREGEDSRGKDTGGHYLAHFFSPEGGKERGDQGGGESDRNLVGHFPYYLPFLTTRGSKEKEKGREKERGKEGEERRSLSVIPLTCLQKKKKGEGRDL